MTYQPAQLKLWAHYSGVVWPAAYSSGCVQSRDSDTLERSNFACMLKAIGGESDTVQVVRERLWAVGWVEWIAIHQDDEAALRIADEVQERLEAYPVINEDHWSDLEHADANETWMNCYSPQERIDYIRCHRSQFEFHDMADLIGCVRGQYFAGYACELLN
jgi:hypothetical protein